MRSLFLALAAFLPAAAFAHPGHEDKTLLVQFFQPAHIGAAVIVLGAALFTARAMKKRARDMAARAETQNDHIE